MKTLVMISAVAAAVAMVGCTKAPEVQTPEVQVSDTQTPTVQEVKASTTVSYTALLAPGKGVTSSGSGLAELMYDPDTNTLTYTVTYKDLTGPATAAHIHGPAKPDEDAGVVIPFASAASPITGTAVLTDVQADDLVLGHDYVNIHTAANPGGEIRGQILSTK